MTILEKAALAEKAARAAGAMLERRGQFQIRRKAENDFVTEMDLRSEQMIRGILLGACPEDQFFGEETGGAASAQGRWIVDPIDGTANYMRGEKEYAISIAYQQDGQMAVGCVYCPAFDELFLAARGVGATCNGRPIRVNGTDRLRDAVAHMGFGHRNADCLRRTLSAFPALMAAVSDVRRSGSAAYDLCCVAAGRCEAFLELGLSLYDYAAGYVILTEAGGRMTGWDPGEDAIATGNLIATNGLLHEKLRAVLLG